MPKSRSFPYRTLAQYAGEHLAATWAEPIAIGAGAPLPDCSAGVYVAIDVDGSVAYVGSFYRPGDSRGGASRISEHLRNSSRFRSWNLLYIFPLKADTSLSDVRRIEGRVGAHL